MSLPIFVNSDTVVRWDQMRRKTDDAFVNDAIVLMTLKDSDGDDVAGAVNISLVYLSDSNGRYHGTIPNTVSLTLGARYTIVLTARSASLGPDERQIPVTAQYRGAS